uniref:Uncharacterized protein n=1 Tax=Romanomermis culicivorax TaxID=13658 RepID=A0A915JWJ9_ROMCU
MLNETTTKISAVKPIPLNRHQQISKSTRTIFVANAIGDHAMDPRPKENTYAVYPNTNFWLLWEQHIHYNAAPAPYVTTPTDSSCTSSQSLELLLTLPALPSSSTVTMTALDM